MVFAKTSKAAARLSEQVRNKTFKKEYLAIVDGKFKKEKGTLEDYLLKTERNNTSKVVKEGTKNSKYAKLDYEVLKYNEDINLSLVKILLHTGRHHQIRVQLANVGHSICGDQKYGTRGRGKQLLRSLHELPGNLTGQVRHEPSAKPVIHADAGRPAVKGPLWQKPG